MAGRRPKGKGTAKPPLHEIKRRNQLIEEMFESGTTRSPRPKG